MKKFEEVIDIVAGDGGKAPVLPEELEMFKGELRHIVDDAAAEIWGRRFESENTRYNRWDGQSADGKKHQDAMDGEKVFPFEGASDARLRIADMVVNERVFILLAAAWRATSLVNVKGMESQDDKFANRMQTLLKYVLKSLMGAQYRFELLRLANYVMGDSPGAGVMGVYWQQEWALKMETVTLESLAKQLIELGATPEDLTSLLEGLKDPTREDVMVQVLQSIAPYLSDKRAKQVVRDLRENDTAEYPMPYVKLNQPALCAHRLCEDIFFPRNTRDLKRSRYIFVREWVTAAELRERQISHEYKKEFVEAVLETQEGYSFVEEWLQQYAVTGDTSLAAVSYYGRHQHEGEYELLTIYYKASNDDNIPGIYYTTFNGGVDLPATDRELCDYPHGSYPHTWFAREVLTSRLWDSRGIPEILMTEQSAMKFLHDSFCDNAQIASMPPIKVPARRSEIQLVIKPLGQIKEQRPGEINWMTPPQYPNANQTQQAEIWKRINLYFGRASEEVPQMLTQLHMQHDVDNFLTCLKDVLMQLMQLCQAYMTPEELGRITGTDGTQLIQSREEIEGKFDLEISFSVDALDMETLMMKFKLITDYLLKTDTLSTIQRDRLVAWMFSAIDANLAEATMIPPQAANKKEEEDETLNFMKIMDGVEPPMVEEGQNFGLRLQTLMGIVQKNPEMPQKLSPLSKQMLEARIKHLQMQVQQGENAVIGRTGARPVLDGLQGMQGMKAA